jgi:hypothetical protein
MKRTLTMRSPGAPDGLMPMNGPLEYFGTERPFVGPNDIEFSGEEEGAKRLTMSPLQRGVRRQGAERWPDAMRDEDIERDAPRRK